MEVSATVLPASKRTDFFEFPGHNSDENARMSMTDRSDTSAVENPQNATHSEPDEQQQATNELQRRQEEEDYDRRRELQRLQKARASKVTGNTHIRKLIKSAATREQ